VQSYSDASSWAGREQTGPTYEACIQGTNPLEAPDVPTSPRPIGSGPAPAGAQATRPRAVSAPLGPRARAALSAAKIVVLGYWLWVLIATLRADRSGFDAIVVLSAPLLLSLHFVQGLMLLRVLRGRSPWWRDFLMILFFGMVHLWPLLRDLRTRRPAPR
jgi:uncharacterized protein YhhL (DUF1145 family)